MNATGSGVGGPFSDGLDAGAIAQRRPRIDDEVMRRLRSPFETDPGDLPEQQELAHDRR